MGLKVFASFHHQALYYSLKLLFEDRLGCELYRPIGFEWFDAGFWKIADSYANPRDTANQYLAINNDGWIPYKNMNGDNYIEDGVYYCHQLSHDYYHKAITLNKFKEMKFDLIISSIPKEDKVFAELARRYQPQAKLISQCGNTFQKSDLKYVMSSVPIEGKGYALNQDVVYYHQEISRKMFYHEPPKEKKITSFVNCYPYPETYIKYKDSLPEFEFKYHGADCPDGAVAGEKAIAPMMRKAMFGWHLKPWGGLGHTAMQWALSGRPVIIRSSDTDPSNRNKETEYLWEDGVTCVDLDRGSAVENIFGIKRLASPDKILRVCQEVDRRAKDIFDYDREFKDILEPFIERVMNNE